MDAVVARTPVEAIGAPPAAALVADDDVAPRAAAHDVLPPAPTEVVVAPSAPDAVGPRAASRHVRAGAQHDAVVPPGAREHDALDAREAEAARGESVAVDVGPGVEQRVSVRRVIDQGVEAEIAVVLLLVERAPSRAVAERVVAEAPDREVVAGRVVEHVPARAAEHVVVPRPRPEDVVPAVTQDPVGPRRADEGLRVVRSVHAAHRIAPHRGTTAPMPRKAARGGGPRHAMSAEAARATHPVSSSSASIPRRPADAVDDSGGA